MHRYFWNNLNDFDYSILFLLKLFSLYLKNYLLLSPSRSLHLLLLSYTLSLSLSCRIYLFLLKWINMLQQYRLQVVFNVPNHSFIFGALLTENVAKHSQFNNMFHAISLSNKPQDSFSLRNCFIFFFLNHTVQHTAQNT